MTDLNIFLPPGAGLQQLTDAYNINDHGEITGLGVPPVAVMSLSAVMFSF